MRGHIPSTKRNRSFVWIGAVISFVLGVYLGYTATMMSVIIFAPLLIMYMLALVKAKEKREGQ